MTFDCTDIKATLSGLVDDEVDAETRHLAERHLATCAPCRALVNEAEGLDGLIAMDAAMLAPTKLPAGFVDAVLDRTVFARAYEQAGWNWTSWLGWVAAAACLGLAASIWFLDRQTYPQTPGSGPTLALQGTNPNDARSTRVADASDLRSWTFEGGLEPAIYRPAATVEYVPIDAEFTLDDATRSAIDEQLASVQPTRTALADLVQRSTITEADSDTLHGTAVLLDMLDGSDLSNFSDLERVRDIAVYDELPQRLADVRTRLRANDRAAALAAESILLRIVNGPIDLNDLRMLRDTANSMQLSKQIDAIGETRDRSTSL